MSTSKRYPPEVQERAVRLVFEQQGEHESQWAAIGALASKIGCATETLRKWVRQAERDHGKRSCPSRSSTPTVLPMVSSQFARSCRSRWQSSPMESRTRELALFDLGIGSKLRACDLVKLRVGDICHGDRVASRATVLHRKTQRPVQFETRRTPGRHWKPGFARPA